MKTLCLNMIVKNESHIIEKTLQNLCDKIKFDYWVISDTGSNDSTQNIIKNFFNNKKIKGELFEDEWKDFGHNRTVALNHAYNKSDYLLIFDADDELIGDFKIKEEDLIYDGYNLKFEAGPIKYSRIALINNRKKWHYLGVLHEYIESLEINMRIATLCGNYFILSGRTGYRNKNPNKYLNDAIILEKEYVKEKNNNNDIHKRYAYYCANSYYDHGFINNEEQYLIKAIEWYKVYLKIGAWDQEKYMSCKKIYECYQKLNQKETGFFYLIESYSYDKNRIECIYYLIAYYCSVNMFDIALMYYLLIKEWYENNYSLINIDILANEKLFIEIDKYDFLLPYYMTLVSGKLNQYEIGIKMYYIIFKKQHPIFEKWIIENLFQNLPFFIEKTPKDFTEFFESYKNYIIFLKNNNFPMEIIQENINKCNNYLPNKTMYATKNNILIFTGPCDKLWNETYMKNNALGGSESAVVHLSKSMSKEYSIYITGNVKDETNDNIHYVGFKNLGNLIFSLDFEVVIISRYLYFFEMFPNIKTKKTYLWAHDVKLCNSGTNMSSEQILYKWNHIIDGCICLTNWHKDLYVNQYPMLKNKIKIINNGIELNLFSKKTNKIKNKFIYTSCSERGLDRILELWPEIIRQIPDATLEISSYNKFPREENLLDCELNKIIKKYNNIKHLGSLNKTELYDLMFTAEYWFYPTCWAETSCITALEMLMSEVICLYYPVAGLINTLGVYGIKLERDREIERILKLTDEEKEEIKKRGKEYAESCSWENRVKEWNNEIFKINSDEKSELIIRNHLINISNININPLPKTHVDYLKKIKEIYNEPKIIYDIGSCVLTWTNTAKEIWKNSEYILFDAFEDVEFLYKNKYKYNIGVLSDTDDKEVKWYENKYLPGGNSYYKENNNSIFPEDKYTLKKTKTLDTIVKEKNFPLPDLIKIDVQGSEKDIIMGGKEIIRNAKHLIVEMQHENYNIGAPKFYEIIPIIEELGFKLVSSLFCNNGPDGDYHFINNNK